MGGEQFGCLLHFFALEGWSTWREARELWSYNRWGMPSGPSGRTGEKQKVRPGLPWCLHTIHPSLQEAPSICRVLGTSCDSAALNWFESASSWNWSPRTLRCRPALADTDFACTAHQRKRCESLCSFFLQRWCDHFPVASRACAMLIVL